MSNFRYIRMAGNDLGWKRPHSGRMGGDDYVGTQGLGHEDWNFSHDVWKDDRYHLYLKSTPAGFKEGKFNFVLGAHAHPEPLILGFVENAIFGISELPKQILHRRAEEIYALNEDDSLGSHYGHRSVKQIAKRLKAEAADYRVSVAPKDLHILAQPTPMPSEIYQVSYPGYRALPMTQEEYRELKNQVLSIDIRKSVCQEDETSFPEGLLIEKVHRARERDRRVVKLAKQRFVEKNGCLYCEACSFEPEKHFGSPKLRNRIIEAHHDLPLSNKEHKGETKPSDLRMVCPTCHRAIHTIRPWLTVKEFRKFHNLGS